MPSFFCIKFGLEVAGSFLAVMTGVLICYWKLSESLLIRKTRNPAS